MQVTIFKASKTPTQSGEANTNKWYLKFSANNQNRYLEPFLSRVASKDMMVNEVVLAFNNVEEAVSFANNNNYNYEIIKPTARKIIKKSYASNFN